jgi:hypothetical protein
MLGERAEAYAEIFGGLLATHEARGHSPDL